MRKLAFIPSRTTNRDIPIVSYLEDAGYEVHILVGEKSIFDAYNNARDKLDVKPKDTIILCHDDIEVLINKSEFNDIIDKNLSIPKTGFLGVAGTSHLDSTCTWWNGVQWNNPSLKGKVYHGTEPDGHCNDYGPPGRVVVLDGLFLATKGKIINTIKLRKPELFRGDWDFYDLFYTMQCYVKGLHNVVIPIPVRHDSYGDLAGKEGWEQNKEAFHHMFMRYLPAVV